MARIGQFEYSFQYEHEPDDENLPIQKLKVVIELAIDVEMHPANESRVLVATRVLGWQVLMDDKDVTREFFLHSDKILRNFYRYHEHDAIHFFLNKE
jgi:hypothetical protein